MASHRNLLQLTPDEEDLSTVRDTEVKAALESIFQLNEEGMLTSRIQEILNLQLFQSAKYSHPPMKHATTLSDDPKIKQILEASTPKVQAEMKPKTKFDGIREKLGFLSVSDLSQIGWCEDKHWKLVSRPGDSTPNTLMSFAKVSETCPIVLIDYAIRTINKFLKSCSEHPVLHPIRSIEFSSGFVIIIQPLRKASLKDTIYKTDPLSDWSAKQNSKGSSLPKEGIFLYAKQILKALLVLYEMGFPPLGQVHSGNIFVDGNTCQLGGYENTLLGYRTRFHNMFSDHMEFVDRIMFGHVVYEMSSGRELLSLIPSDEDYKDIDEDIRSFLKCVFQMENESSFIHCIEEIYDHQFIREAKMGDEDSAEPAVDVSEDVKYLLNKVSKGRVRSNTRVGRLKGNVGRFTRETKKRVKEGGKALAIGVGKGTGVVTEKLTHSRREKTTKH